MKSIPYTMQSDVRVQLQYLAEITGIPDSLIKDGGTKERDAISCMIIYRHMDRKERLASMTLIQNLKNKALVSSIVTKIIDTTFVNPQWGIWSLSNKELINDIAFHSGVTTFATTVGLGASALSGKEFIKDIMKARKLGLKNWALLVVWGAIIFNKQELIKAQRELNFRNDLNTSRYYK